MTLLEFKRKDGKPVYVFKENITCFFENPDNSNHTELQVGDHKLILDEKVEAVKKRVEE